MVIEGRLSVREDEPAKLMAESILPIEGYDPKHPQANKPNLMRDATQRLYIRLPSRTCPEYAKVINLLEIFDGDMPVIFYLEDTKQKLAAPRRLYTSGHPLLLPGAQAAAWEHAMLQQNDISAHALYTKRDVLRVFKKPGL